MDNRAIVEIKKLCARHGVSIVGLANHINVVNIRIYEIMKGKRRITVDTDLRLCKFFKLKKRHFIDMQIDYDMAMEEESLKDKLANIKTVDQIVLKRKQG